MTRGRNHDADDAAPERAGHPTRADRSVDRSARVGSDTDRIPRPGWVPTDDVMGPTPDRQALVVGNTPTGLVLVLLLRAAGYDPVVVSGTDRPAASRITYLSPAAVEVLCVLDAGERVLDGGRRVDGVTVRRIGDGGDSRKTRKDPAADRAPPAVVPTPILDRTLGGAVPADVPTQERAVGSVSQRDGGVEVTFDDGVREWFDVVVDAGGGGEPLDPADGSRVDGSLRQHEASVDGDPGGARILDVWRSTGVVQRLPTPTASRHLVRVTTRPSERSPLDPRPGEGPAHVDAAVFPDSGAFDRRRVRQTVLPDGTPATEWWGRGRIARCGPAACPAAPAAGVAASLGITDALGLVAALAREETPVPAAVGAYADGRCRRLAALRRDADLPDPSAGSDGPLGSLRALRAVALEPFFGTAPPALGGPGSGSPGVPW